MTVASPTLESVIAAVKTAIDAVNASFGTVLDADLKYESELEAIEDYQQGSGGGNEWAIDLWVVTCERIDEVAGEAVGENYSIFNVVCKYWNVRANDSTWEKTARTQVEAVRDAINQNSSIFRTTSVAIKGTPETASIERAGFENVEGMLVYKARVVLQREARRWS